MAEEEEEIEVAASTKVAILMIALGQETTAEVMKYLNDIEIEQIAEAIAGLDVVTTEQEDEVLEEFEQLLIAGKYVSQGGMDFARGALEKALGPRKAQGLLDRVTSTTTSGFYMLRNVDPNQIIPFLSKEHASGLSIRDGCNPKPVLHCRRGSRCGLFDHSAGDAALSSAHVGLGTAGLAVIAMIVGSLAFPDNPEEER